MAQIEESPALAGLSDEDILIEIGLRLQSIRKRRRLKQPQVFEATGIKVSTLSRYETGASKSPSVAKLLRLAEFYDVDAEWLFGDLWSTRVMSKGEPQRWDLITGGSRGDPAQRSLPFLRTAE